jgi:hypothetical protein
MSATGWKQGGRMPSRAHEWPASVRWAGRLNLVLVFVAWRSLPGVVEQGVLLEWPRRRRGRHPWHACVGNALLLAKAHVHGVARSGPRPKALTMAPRRPNLFLGGGQAKTSQVWRIPASSSAAGQGNTRPVVDGLAREVTVGQLDDLAAHTKQVADLYP